MNQARLDKRTSVTPHHRQRKAGFLILACVLVSLLAASPASGYVTHFPQECSGCFHGLDTPEGIAVDESSHVVYVTISGQKNVVRKFDEAGNPVNFSALGSPDLPAPAVNGGFPTHIAVDTAGNIYVLYTGGGGEGGGKPTLFKFLPGGELDPTTPSIELPGSKTARGVAVAPSGDIYLTANYLNPSTGAFEKAEVEHFNAGGELVGAFGAGTLKSDATDLALDSEGDIYVSDGQGTYGFDEGGSCLDSCEAIELGRPEAIATEPVTDRLYVSESVPGTESEKHLVTEYASFAKGSGEVGSFTYTGPSGHPSFVPDLAIDGPQGKVLLPNLFEVAPEQGAVTVFGPSVIVPTVQLQPASSVQQSSATLNGTVNTDGTEAADAPTDCHFEYVTEEAFQQTGFADLSSGGSAPCQPSAAEIPDDAATHSVSASIGSLEESTAYRVRLVAANENGPNSTRAGSFVTAGPPVVALTYMDQIQHTSAVLHAKVNPLVFDTHAHFEYLTLAAHEANLAASEDGFAGAVSTASTDLGGGFGDVPFEAGVSALQPGTSYVFRVVADNAAAEVQGPVKKFTTIAPALFAITGATKLSPTGATVSAYVDPLGQATSYRFEYGATAEYGQSTASAPAGAGNGFVLESSALTGLQPGAEYHFRVVATNTLGTAYSPDFQFTTTAAVCPNQKLRVENNSAGMPECRAYEQVSPEAKAGAGPTELSGFSNDRFIYRATGSFAGDVSGNLSPIYLATRGPSGWSTEAISVPYNLGRPVLIEMSGVTPDYTEFMTSPVVLGAVSDDEVNAATVGTVFMRHADGSFTPASPPLEVQPGSAEPDLYSSIVVGGPSEWAGSADLTHRAIVAATALMPSAYAGARDHAYEIDASNPASPQLRILSQDNEGNELVPCAAYHSLQIGGGSASIGGSAFHPVSEDGSKVFFDEASASLSGGCGTKHLLARIEAQATLDLAEPEANAECTGVECKAAPVSSAIFEGASADGSKVFFVSAQQLTDDASEDPETNAGDPFTGSCTEPSGTGCNLYKYDFSRPAGHNLLALSAGDSSGLGPRVMQIIGVSPNGSHVYFVARGVLTAQPNSLGAGAHAGAENLYVANAETGQVGFVSDLCSGLEKSGVATELASCPGEGVDDGRRVDVTEDGRFLILSTYAQLTPDDTNLAQDVYRYDAESESLVRISVGHDGEDQNGNGGGQNALAGGNNHPGNVNSRYNDAGQHVISDDGSTVVFTTPRPLQSTAENGLSNVYEWHQGEVTLVSGGKAANSASNPSIGPSGSDISFVSSQNLVPGDRDGLGDAYDLNVDGGFPLPPPPPASCESPEACHGPATGEPTPPSLGTEEFRAPGNPPGEKPKQCKKGFHLKHGKCVKRKAHRKHRHRRSNGNRGGTK